MSDNTTYLETQKPTNDDNPLIEIFFAIKVHKMLFISLIVLGFIVSLIVTYLYPTKFIYTATIKIGTYLSPLDKNINLRTTLESNINVESKLINEFIPTTITEIYRDPKTATPPQFDIKTSDDERYLTLQSYGPPSDITVKNSMNVILDKLIEDHQQISKEIRKKINITLSHLILENKKNESQIFNFYADIKAIDKEINALESSHNKLKTDLLSLNVYITPLKTGDNTAAYLSTIEKLRIETILYLDLPTKISNLQQQEAHKEYLIKELKLKILQNQETISLYTPTTPPETEASNYIVSDTYIVTNPTQTNTRKSASPGIIMVVGFGLSLLISILLTTLLEFSRKDYPVS